LFLLLILFAVTEYKGLIHNNNIVRLLVKKNVMDHMILHMQSVANVENVAVGVGCRVLLADIVCNS